MHHPFTSRDEDLVLMETEPQKVRAKAYDIILNGVEIGGEVLGFIKDVQELMFKTLGLSSIEAHENSVFF